MSHRTRIQPVVKTRLRKLISNLFSIKRSKRSRASTSPPWTNSAAVRQAFFVPFTVPKYETCSPNVTGAYTKQSQEMSDLVKNALNEELRVLFMHGDADLACNWLMGQRFASSLGRTLVSDKTAFIVDDQVGGFHTAYEGVEFVTVRGGSHVVAETRPAATLYVLNTFLKGEYP
ncbi:hypothetical protein L596_001165 [Steinernema carpocapsae]|uniref:Uncharacterized protein n=1 Tax=Steinernema carpocapsae TaxID=34508 RepID=A0A4U8UKP3_STECR|nr:hypothetical protein L596_001165 [Steinernema carpocapsae]